MMSPPLNQSQSVGEATRLLRAGGFQQADSIEFQPNVELRVFEDARSIVGVVFFRSWDQLSSHWLAAQAALVDRISSRFRRGEAKSWDGYLVLLTSDRAPTTEAVTEVRRDTKRLRKLIASGADLTSLESVTDVLLPVLPLQLDGSETVESSLLDRIPTMLEAHDVDPVLAEAAIASFEANRTPMEGISDWRSRS